MSKHHYEFEFLGAGESMLLHQMEEEQQLSKGFISGQSCSVIEKNMTWK